MKVFINYLTEEQINGLEAVPATRYNEPGYEFYVNQEILLVHETEPEYATWEVFWFCSGGKVYRRKEKGGETYIELVEENLEEIVAKLLQKGYRFPKPYGPYPSDHRRKEKIYKAGLKALGYLF